MTVSGSPMDLRALAAEPYDGDRLVAAIRAVVGDWRYSQINNPSRLPRQAELLAVVLDGLEGASLQQRWASFERELWPRWLTGEARPAGPRWSQGVAAVVLARAVRPTWAVLIPMRVARWVCWLPERDPLVLEAGRLRRTVEEITWLSEPCRTGAVWTGVRIMLAGGLGSLVEITDEHLHSAPVGKVRGIDALDAALCALGVLERTPRRGIARHAREQRPSAAELVNQQRIPERFRAVSGLYLEAHSARVSDVYSTLRLKRDSLADFWRYLDACHPEVRRCADVLPAHALGFVDYAIELGRDRGRGSEEQRDHSKAAHACLVNVRTFFRDICSWGTEPGSPFAEHMARAIPLERHNLTGIGFEQARRRDQARMVATVLDLEREVPKIRAYTLQRWHEAEQRLREDPAGERDERVAFWDWALLELLVQSGLRIEEACELTTLDVLRRQLADGRLYYLLHVKPSKFDRARVIPIGDGLGRVIAEIIRHVRRFNQSDAVPSICHRDHREKRDLPRAPYLLQSLRYPAPISGAAIRKRLAALSREAGAHADPRDPGAARSRDARHRDGLRKALPKPARRGIPQGRARHLRGPPRPRDPPGANRRRVAEFSASCSLRDMGTHVCALPTGEHCSRGLVCLGCTHAQPKKSAAPVFRRMLVSHRRTLTKAREHQEPAGQLASRELEIVRIEGALRRAEELNDDVAASIEDAAA